MPGDPLSPPPPRRSRFARFMLFAPAALLAVVLAGASGGWWLAQGRLSAEMDARAEALRQAGWSVAWTARTVSGFPFRLKVALEGLALSAPGEHAWGLAAPQLEGQAYLIQPTHWVFAAPQGLTITRPMGGPLQVTGKDLRASIAGLTASPWRIAVAGDALAFAPGAGAKPFSFTAADHLEAHLRPSSTGSGPRGSPPDGSGDGDVLVEIDGGRAARDSVIWNLAQDAPVSVAASGRLSRLAAAHGAGVAQALDAWSQAGGALRIDRLSAVGGRTHVTGQGGLLGLGPEGRLDGGLPLVLRQDPVVVGADGKVQAAPPSTPGAAAQAAADRGGGVDFPVIFRGGRMHIGPADVGPAPMVR